MARLPHDKAALRTWARASRDGLGDDERARASAAVVARVDREILARLPAGAAIALYAAIPGELPTDGIAAAALARGLRLAYPRVVPGDRRLRFHLARPADLVPGTFQIPEPPATLPTIDLADLALVLIPGLLFDRSGRRLGWGGGYYDATLPASPAIRVGLAYELQLVDELPQDGHDQPVHLIATDVALHPGAPGPLPWTS